VAVDHAKPDINLVAALRDLTRREHLSYVNPRVQCVQCVQCVQWHMPFLLTEKAVDPGITQVYTDLMTSGGHGNTYSVRLPRNSGLASVGACQEHLGRRFGATLLAVRFGDELVVTPEWDRPVDAGTTLHYVGRERIDASTFAAGG